MEKIIIFYPKSTPRGLGRIPYVYHYLERMIRHLKIKLVLIDEQVTPNYKIPKNTILACVSVMTGYQIRGAIEFSKFLKFHDKNIPIIWGGWHPTILPQQCLKEKYVDSVIMGQGELAFKEIVERVIKKRPIAKIYRPKEYMPQSNYPQINYKLINLDPYIYKSAYSERCIGYFASHGCPYNCAFCCVSTIYKHKWHKKSIKTIIHDLKVLKRHAKIDSITFDDDNFFVNKEHTINLCKAMIKHNLNLLWDTSAHAGLFLKLFNDKDLKLMYRAGCRQIYIGAESGDQTILNDINKHAIVQDNYDFVKLLSKHDITPFFSIMMCFPNNPDRDLKLTIDMVRKAKLINPALRVRMFFFTPYPGTKMYEQAIKKGFKPYKKLEGWINHSLRKFIAPWWNRDYRQEIELFANFYLPLTNPNYYKIAPLEVQKPLRLVNKLFHPICKWRMKHNNFKFPIEGKLFLYLLKIYNKKFKKDYSLGFESYL